MDIENGDDGSIGRMYQLYGDIPMRPSKSDDLETVLLVDSLSETKKNPWFKHISDYVSSGTDNMDTEAKMKHVYSSWKFFDGLFEKYKDPRFAVNHFDYLSEKTKDMGWWKRRKFLNRAYECFKLMNDECNDPYFNIHFFDYLFERTEKLSKPRSKRLVNMAYDVFHALVWDIREAKIAGENVFEYNPTKAKAFFQGIKPKSKLRKDLGFDRDLLCQFRRDLKATIRSEINVGKVVKQETVADCIDYVAEKGNLF